MQDSYVDKVKYIVEGITGVCIRRRAYTKMMLYTINCPHEITGFGIVTKRDHQLIIEDVFILKQEVSGVSADIDGEALIQAMMKESAAGKDTSKWNFWWHSHAGMKPFYSHKDLNTLDLLQSSKPLISAVTNHRGHVLARIDEYSPVRSHEYITIEVIDDVTDKLEQQIQKDIARLVKVYEPPVVEITKLDDDWIALGDTTKLLRKDSWNPYKP